jgi:hypothetical protein
MRDRGRDGPTRRALQLRLATAALTTLLALLSGCATGHAPPSKEMRTTVHSDAVQMMTDIDAAAARDTGVGLSSNPFDYIGVSPAWGRLVKRGKPALESIAAEIEDSKEDGLREYLLASAGQAILDEPPSAGVATGKGWVRSYRSK